MVEIPWFAVAPLDSGSQSAMMFLSLAFVGFDTQLAVMRFFISGMSFDAAQIHLEFS